MQARVQTAARAFGLLLICAAASPATAAAPECAPPIPPPPGKMRVTFMGVSTLLFEDARTQILFDGFFSRPGPFKVAFGTIKPDPKRIAAAMCRGGVGEPAAIFTAHAHYDHAMDAAAIAAERNGVLVGSKSVAALGEGHELPPSQIEAFEGAAQWSVGCFRVTAIPSLHASPDRWEGDIERPLKPPAKARAYRNGGAYSYLIEHGKLRILVHPSAGSRPGLYEGQKADVVFLGVGSLGVKDLAATSALWAEAVVRTEASEVYPIHWDNFARPLEQPLRATPWPLDHVPTTRKRLANLSASGDVKVRWPEVFAPLSFSVLDNNCGASDPRLLRRVDK